VGEDQIEISYFEVFGDIADEAAPPLTPKPIADGGLVRPEARLLPLLRGRSADVESGKAVRQFPRPMRQGKLRLWDDLQISKMYGIPDPIVVSPGRGPIAASGSWKSELGVEREAAELRLWSMIFVSVQRRRNYIHRVRRHPVVHAISVN
jgi:hypothetical protein